MNHWIQECAKCKPTELTNLDFTWENVQQARNFIAVNPSYKAAISQPIFVLLQSKKVGDSAETYPNSNDPIQCIFENNLLNKKDRFLNSDTRIWAIKALLLGPFIYEEPLALLRVMRLLGSQC